jgi:hypothetical protein
MKKIILQQAIAELGDAIEYYEQQQRGLGLKLKKEVEEMMKWIEANPLTPQLRDGGYRCVNLKIFPYYNYIAYLVRQENLWILAIAHSHRKPFYWIKRIP